MSLDDKFAQLTDDIISGKGVSDMPDSLENELRTISLLNEIIAPQNDMPAKQKQHLDDVVAQQFEQARTTKHKANRTISFRQRRQLALRVAAVFLGLLIFVILLLPDGSGQGNNVTGTATGSADIVILAGIIGGFALLSAIAFYFFNRRS